jgi:hemolysin D
MYRHRNSVLNDAVAVLPLCHAGKLADVTSKLSDAREQLNKSQLRRQLVELRADRDATVLSIAKVSVGLVLPSGQHFITTVPSDAQLEIEADIPSAEAC